MENLHLADGENCTLALLKRAIGFDQSVSETEHILIQMKTLIKSISRLCRMISGDYFREFRELEAHMKHWHEEETTTLHRAQEAVECRNMQRAAMWLNRNREARLRCEKDFRRPMMALTGNPKLFEMKP